MNMLKMLIKHMFYDLPLKVEIIFFLILIGVPTIGILILLGLS